MCVLLAFFILIKNSFLINVYCSSFAWNAECQKGKTAFCIPSLLSSSPLLFLLSPLQCLSVRHRWWVTDDTQGQVPTEFILRMSPSKQQREEDLNLPPRGSEE